MSTGARRGWRAAAASVTGVSHLRDGLPCQDAHAWKQVEARSGDRASAGVLIAAVADGAGSAPCAAEGARAAVRAAVDQAATVWRLARPRERDDWGQLIQGAFTVARLAVQSEAKSLGRPLADLSTTLLLAVATPHQTAAGQIGDGAIVAHFDGEELTALTKPPRTEHLNETTFLTSDDAFAELQFALCDEPARGLAMLSDGLQMLALKMPLGEPYAPFFTPLLRFTAGAAEPDRAEERLREFLQSPAVTRRTDDDLTLLLAVREVAR